MNMQENKENTVKDNQRPEPQMLEQQTSVVESHIVIRDPDSGEIILNRRD